MKRGLIWLPLGMFALIFAVVAIGLTRPAERTVRSAMVGKTLPAFTVGAIVPGKPGLSNTMFADGKPRLLNVFASWCIPCIAEAPMLLRLKKMGVAVDGLAIRDTSIAIRAFLARNGDPYERIGDDRQSAVQLALGSSGVPETFVIDGKGRIVLQHVGDIRADDIPEILAALEKAK
ncbi:alkyl hydroperoxide reductase [Sphingomonas sp. Leaf357]|uniref:redoxin family protein n=1 Tax=Sphingomonas sp. Leaf357 TaxID=1736350 RepID=UPI0006F5CD9B|nr:redoxin family protein [Sphingomonas sp. Leaf357]KQS01441.1 alkyl hydroperoxide reductase [Sphingomonas sp. Leaf357]